jgi:hypothetical protein
MAYSGANCTFILTCKYCTSTQKTKAVQWNSILFIRSWPSIRNNVAKWITMTVTALRSSSFSCAWHITLYVCTLPSIFRQANHMHVTSHHVYIVKHFFGFSGSVTFLVIITQNSWFSRKKKCITRNVCFDFNVFSRQRILRNTDKFTQVFKQSVCNFNQILTNKQKKIFANGFRSTRTDTTFQENDFSWSPSTSRRRTGRR